MRKILSITLLSLLLQTWFNAKAQKDSAVGPYLNTSLRMMKQKDKKLTIGGYGQIDYNQEIDKNTNYNGNLDVHRMILMFGYKFNAKTSFFTELEIEHVEEVYVEQAFLNHKINTWLNFRAGLMLIPMGIVNEYHEPPSFNGVERPNVDKYIVPSTWREIGFGFTGKFNEYSLRYQLYLTNGFLGYDDAAKFNGKSALRGGRQKGIESVLTSPNINGRLDYYAIPGLKIGFSGYFGKSQSTVFNGLDKNDEIAKKSADSTVVGISMIGFDARYNVKGIGLRGQITYSKHSNTKAYNEFTGSDFGSEILGLYVEASYNVFQSMQTRQELALFIRYESYDTQLSVAEGVMMDDANYRQEYIFGLGLKMHKWAVLKADYQIVKYGTSDQRNFYNMGVGIMF